MLRFRGNEQTALLRPVRASCELFRGARSWRHRACRRAAELEILQTIRDKVPPEVFTTPYKNPVGGSPEAARNNQRDALRLLREPGYELRDRKLVNVKTREPVQARF